MRCLRNRPPAATQVVAIALIATAAITYADPSAIAGDSKIRIVSLTPGPPACPIGTDPATLTFQRGMREAGYGAEDYSQYCYSSLSEVPKQVREILATKPTVLLVWGSAVAAKAVRDATTTLPVVFADVADPVKNGLVASLAHPGGNMTGLTNVTEELVAKRIELLKEALPSLTRIAVLGNVTWRGPVLTLPAEDCGRDARYRASLPQSSTISRHPVRLVVSGHSVQLAHRALKLAQAETTASRTVHPMALARSPVD